jgi:hypothetical protein
VSRQRGNQIGMIVFAVAERIAAGRLFGGVVGQRRFTMFERHRAVEAQFGHALVGEGRDRH